MRDAARRESRTEYVRRSVAANRAAMSESPGAAASAMARSAVALAGTFAVAAGVVAAVQVVIGFAWLPAPWLWIVAGVGYAGGVWVGHEVGTRD